MAQSQYPADAYYKGDVDELRIYDRALSPDEVANAMQGGMGYGIANTPSPANKAANLLPQVSLNWVAGQEGKTHDVYFGAGADDVANATTVKPLGVLVSPGQTATTYNAGRLEFGKTYFWRVDEVGAAPDLHGLQRKCMVVHHRAARLYDEQGQHHRHGLQLQQRGHGTGQDRSTVPA